MGARPSTLFLFTTPPRGGACVPGTPPGPVNDRSGLRRGMCSFLPWSTSGLDQPGACAGPMPAKFCRPVPGDRLDERTTSRWFATVAVRSEARPAECLPDRLDKADDACPFQATAWTSGRGRLVSVICVSYLCHIYVIYEQKFNFPAGRPPDR